MKMNKFVSNNLGKVDNLMLYIGYLIIVLYGFWHMHEVYQPSIIYDEYGYWNAGAYFAGLDWSGISSLSTYYSYGYGMILAVLQKIIPDAILRYRVAIFINIIMYLVSYELSVRFAQKISKGQMSERWIYFWAIVITLYSANQYQITTTMAETTIYCSYWILINMLCSYLEKNKFPYLLLTIVMCFWLYIIHQRTIGIVAAFVIVIVCNGIIKKNFKLKNVALSIMVVIIAIIVISTVKTSLINNVYAWNDTATAGANDYSGQFGKIAGMFTVNGSKMFATSLAGKLFYIIVASCGLTVWGIAQITKYIIANVKKSYIDSVTLIYFFVILSMIFMIGVNNVYMYGAGRIDTIFYGRYSEFALAPIMLIGGMYINRCPKNKIIISIALLSIVIFAFIFKNRLEICRTYQLMQSSGISLFYDYDTDTFCLKLCVFFGVICLLLEYVACIKKSNRILCAMGICMVLYWSISAYISLNNEYLFNQRKMLPTKQCADVIEGYDKEIPIYFLYNEDTYESRAIFAVQYYLKDRTIHMISEQEEKKLTDDYILFVEKDEKINYGKYIVVNQADEMVMLVPKNSLMEKYIQDRYELGEYDITDISRGLNKNGKKSFELSSKYNTGYIAACQYLTLEPGEYEITYDIYSKGNKSKNIGWVDICKEFGDEIVYSKEIILANTNDISNYIVTVKIFINCETHDVEMRVASNGKSNIGINSIRYRKIN